MEIDKSLTVPLYQQVRVYLEEKIRQKEWEGGHRVPTEKELASQFNVSTITIKRAIHDLVDEGLLYRQSGKGTFVTEGIEQNISKLVSVRNEAWEDHSHPHRTLSFKQEKAGTATAKLLEINEADDVYKINRIKLQGDQPVAIEYSFIPTSLVPDLDELTIENELLYNLFENKYGVKLKTAKVYFNTVVADEFESELLQVPLGEQLFVLERYTLTEENSVIEYSKFILKQDQSKYFLEIPL